MTEPASEEVLGRVANLDREDIKKAISSADLGQIEFYKSTTALQRGVLLRKWYDAINANADDREYSTPMFTKIPRRRSISGQYTFW